MTKEITIRKEIEKFIKSKDPDLVGKICEEIDLMEITNGLEGKTNLESFYELWKKNKGKTGKKNDINSWTAYALGLTSKKPDGEFMPERRAFARSGFPDIDMDFDYFCRQDIYDYIIKKYGRDNVGNIGTYAALKIKSAVRRIGKALDIANAFFKDKGKFVTENEAKVSEIINSLPYQMGAFIKVYGQDGEVHLVKTIQDAYNLCPAFKQYLDTYPEILEHSKNIEGLLSIFSTHPAGIVISDIPLESIAPLRRARESDLSTQYAYECLEQSGLIKIDVLAISTLTVIQRTINLVEENYGIKIDYENLPLDDDATLALYRTGKLNGVFQCETEPMQKVMRGIGVDRFEDIVVAIALFRPGPMVSIPEYCARKKGKSEVDYFHPSIEPFVKPYLEKTHGILCLHEDTEVAMADGGSMPIKYISKGDSLVSINTDTLSSEIKKCDGCSPTRFGNGLRIELENGYNVIVTEDHKILTFNGMIEAANLNLEKDLIACPEYITRSKSTPKGRSIRKMLGKEISVAYLFGLLIGDGCVSSSSCAICFGTEKNADKIIDFIETNLINIKTTKYFHCRAWYISVYSDDIFDWKKFNTGNRKTRYRFVLDKNGINGKTCYNKRIPEYILQSNRSVRSSFLAGLLDSDGMIDTNGINISSVNNDLLNDLRHLCNGLGLVTRLDYKYHKIYIHNHNELNSLLGKYLIIKQGDIKSDLCGDKVGWIPKYLLSDKQKQDGISQRRFEQKYKLNRLNIFGKNTKNNLVSTGIARKIGLFYGDLRYYRIKKIETINNVQFYGISVRDNHNFIGNGIVLSNCYQEQVMQVCNSLAGFSISDGYVMIKAIGKKKEYLMKRFEKQFIVGCVKNGVPKNIAQEYWDKFITPFAFYGFNLSHSLAYGFASYISCYLKAHYPDEFFVSLLNVENERKKHEKIDVFFKDAKSFDIEFSDHDINKCEVFYRIVKKKDVSSGVMKTEISPSIMVKGIGQPSAEELMRCRPYTNLRDMAFKTNTRLIGLDTISSLIDAGFFQKAYKQSKKKDKSLEFDSFKESVLSKFKKLREDRRSAGNKGVESTDIFA